MSEGPQMPHGETRYEQPRTVDGTTLVMPAAARCAWLHWNRFDVSRAPLIPDAIAINQHCPAYVNHGSWVVKCPSETCQSVQFACFTDRRFYCVDCLNDWCGNAWAIVDWPDESKLREIERILLVRDVEHQSWHESESVEWLQRENDEHADELRHVTPHELRRSGALVPLDPRQHGAMR